MIFLAWTFLLTGLVVSSLGAANVHDADGLTGLFTNWLFLLGFFLITGSVFFKKFFVSHGKSETDISRETNLSSLKGKIMEVINALERISERRSILSLRDFYQEIDKILSNQIFEIVEARQSIIGVAGYGAYGTFMSDFATGERFISRSWSAAVDGYDEEAFEYIAKAIPFFQKAQQQYNRMIVY